MLLRILIKKINKLFIHYLEICKLKLYKVVLNGPIAQLVEQVTFNHWVAGSNPAGLTIYKSFILEIISINNQIKKVNIIL